MRPESSKLVVTPSTAIACTRVVMCCASGSELPAGRERVHKVTRTFARRKRRGCLGVVEPGADPPNCCVLMLCSKVVDLPTFPTGARKTSLREFPTLTTGSTMAIFCWLEIREIILAALAACAALILSASGPPTSATPFSFSSITAVSDALPGRSLISWSSRRRSMLDWSSCRWSVTAARTPS